MPNYYSIVFLSIAVLCLSGIEAQQSTAATFFPTKVRLLAVKKQVLERSVTVAGRSAFINKIGHSSADSGIIIALNVTLGQKVLAGQSLLEIERRNNPSLYKNYHLKARISGLVSELNCSLYDEVQAGVPLVVLADTSNFNVKVALSDRDIADVIGNSRLNMKAVNGRTYMLQLWQAATEINPETQLFYLTFRFLQKPNKLAIGSLLTGNLELRAANILTVEDRAIQRNYQEAYLMVASKTQQVERRLVTTGKLLDGKVAINSGLVAGDYYFSGDELYQLEAGMAIPATINNKQDNSLDK